MAVTTAPFTATDLQYTIPEIWPPEIEREMFPKTVAANWFTDFSKYASEGDTFNVPDVFTNKFTGQAQSTQGAEVTTESPAQSQVQLAINTHKYVAFLIGDKDAVQLLKWFDFQKEYAYKAAGTLRNLFEQAVYTLWSSLSTNTVGDTTTVVTDLEVRQCVSKLDNLNHDLEQCGWHLHPTVYWLQLAGVQKYYDASMRGMNTKSITITGNFGDMDKRRSYKGLLYDMPIFTTTNIRSGLQTYRNMLAHKRTFCYGNQTPSIAGGAGVRTQASYELRNIATLAVVDILYGVKALREDAGVLLNANISATTS